MDRSKEIKERENVIDEIRAEMDMQDNKWGKQHHDEMRWLTILMEEVGEVAEAVNEIYPTLSPDGCVTLYQDNYIDELEQVAAVAIQAICDFRINNARRAEGDGNEK